MKKAGMMLLIAALVMAPIFAAPTGQEVGDTLGGVMMVYALVLMSSMFGVMPEGAEAEMDMEKGDSSLFCDDLDVTVLMDSQAGMGMTASMNGDEDIPEIQFTRMSGEISVDEAGNLLLDVELKGGPVKTLLMKMEEENVVTFKADGKDYRYLTSDPSFLEMFE